MANVIVTSASMGAMACAARLAVKGHDVTVHEPSSSWAPDVQHMAHDGYVFDVGSNLLTLPAVYRDLFLKKGSALEDSVDLIELDMAYRMQFHDGVVVALPGAGIGRISTALGETLGPEAEQQWRTYMSRVGQMWTLTRRIFVEQPVKGLRSLQLLPHPLRDLRTIAVHRTLRSFNSQLLSDQRLIRIAEYFATRIDSDPRNMPATVATETFVEQNFGSLHVTGGLRKLADALHTRCVDLGVRFEFESHVTPVVSEGKVTGVRTRDGAEIRGDFVVVSDDTVHEALVLLAVAGKTDGILHHNVWFGEKSQGELSSADIYACVPNDQSMSPPDSEAWCVRIPFGHESTVNLVGEDHSELIEAVVNELAERGCDLRSRVLWSTTVTSSNTAGSHRSRDLGRLGQLRAPQNITPIEGLFTVGPSVHPGPSLSFVAIGANIVAEAIGSA